MSGTTCLASTVAGLLVAAAPPAVKGQVPQWELERAVVIGDAMDEERGLTGVGDVVVVGSRVIIGQPMERRIRVFTSGGDFVGFIGRRGAGPGEFQSLGRMGSLRDTLWAWDHDLRRVQYFDSDGEYVRSVAVRGHPSISATGLSVQGVFRDGSMLAARSLSGDVASNEAHAPEPILLLDGDGVLRDTVGMLRGLGPAVRHRRGVANGHGLFSLRPVFDRSLWRALPDGSGLVVAHRTVTNGAQGTYQVVRLDADLDTVFTREFQHTPIPISASWLDRRIAERVASWEGTPVVADLGHFRRGVREDYSQLDRFPSVATVEPGTQGATWVELRTGEDSYEWLVLDPDGNPMGRVTSPPGTSIRIANPDGAWFAERDALDIPYLVYYRIRRP